MTRKLDVFYGPSYTAILRPTPKDCEVRSQADANKVLDSSPYPDMGAYLLARKGGIADWVRMEFDPKIAAHMIRFIRTGDVRNLSTLTESEVKRLRDRIEQAHSSFQKK